MAVEAVGILEAKNNLSALVRSLERGEEPSIVILRYDRPVARLVPYEDERPDVSRRVGLFEGQDLIVDDEAFDSYDDEVAELFGA